MAQADVACGTESGGFGGSCSIMSGILGTPDQLIPPDQFPGKPAPAPGIGVGGIGIDPGDTNGVPGVVRLQNGVVIAKGGAVNDIAVAPVVDPLRDRFWPKSVISFLVLATVMTLLSVQFVTPTRRWRPSLPGPVRRLFRGGAPDGTATRPGPVATSVEGGRADDAGAIRPARSAGGACRPARP